MFLPDYGDQTEEEYLTEAMERLSNFSPERKKENNDFLVRYYTNPEKDLSEIMKQKEQAD